MTTQLRKVQVLRYHKNEATGKFEYMPSEIGVFHAWGVDFVEFEAGPGNYTIAIVELDGGKCETFAVQCVRFLDGGAQ